MMPREHILVIEDEVDVMELVRYNLDKNGYVVSCAVTGEEGLSMARQERPDLIVLDLMLPGMDGLEVCRELKSDETTKDIFIVMLTAKSEDADIVTGLELGADDYVTKPFSPRVLLARIKAVLRRNPQKGLQNLQHIVHIHDILIDRHRHKVLVNGSPVELTSTEFRILHFLASHPGWVFTRNQIVDSVHGENYAVTERSVDVQIVSLRKKLGNAGAYIETVRGVGYRFKE